MCTGGPADASTTKASQHVAQLPLPALPISPTSNALLSNNTILSAANIHGSSHEVHGVEGKLSQASTELHNTKAQLQVSIAHCL